MSIFLAVVIGAIYLMYKLSAQQYDEQASRRTNLTRGVVELLLLAFITAVFAFQADLASTTLFLALVLIVLLIRYDVFHRLKQLAWAVYTGQGS